MFRRIVLLLLTLCLAHLPTGPLAAQQGGPLQPPTTGGLPALLQELQMLGHNKRVLLIAAHPDDEDTELLVMLTRREGAETGYLSLTRGEGGQNLIGNELGEALGILRTEELLAARNIDGAQQFFTRAYDFGFSKSLDDTWAHWPKDSVLKDVVRIIRRFRPQVVIGVFQGLPGDGHGQHQAAGVLTREGYLAAGDPARFPELQTEEGLAPWTPSKLYRSARFETAGRTLVFDGGEVERLSGKTYHQLAMMGRSQHRSQDMGRLQEFGASIGGVERLLPAGRDVGEGWTGFWTGVDTVLRAPTGFVQGIAEARRAAGQDRLRVEDAIASAFAALHPAPIDALNSIDLLPLLRARSVVSWAFVDAVADRGAVADGDVVNIDLTVRNAGGRLLESLQPLFGVLGGRGPVVPPLPAIPEGETGGIRQRFEVPTGTPPSTPYFMSQPRIGDMYDWSGVPTQERGEARGTPEMTASLISTFVRSDRVTVVERRYAPVISSRILDQAFGEVRRPVVVVPRVSVKLTPGVAIVSSTASGGRGVHFDVLLEHGATGTTTGSVALELPAGWPRPSAVPFALTGNGTATHVRFEVTAPANAAAGTVEARAVATDVAGRRYDIGAFMVDYPHIRPRQYTRPAIAKLEVVDLVPPPVRRVAYVRGAADRIPEALAGAGLQVTLLDSVYLASGNLSSFDAIVIGPRAYEVDSALVRNNDRILAYARDGGRVIVQYQQQVYLNGHFAPYAVGGNSRITDENSPVTMLGATATQSASAPLFRTPNAIGADDWEGWVQDRALYCPTTWGREWNPLLAMNDPGEAPIRGCLLEAQVGRGSYVYTGLAFFRELPAGVPGAYRLFFNLLGGRVTP